VRNTANGRAALVSNQIGSDNTATGALALFSNTIGVNNTANGSSALIANTTGNANTGIGISALLNNDTGNNNTALGDGAGSNIDGSGNLCIGEGVNGEAGFDDSTYIRNVNTTEQSPAQGVVFVTVRLSDGRLGYQPSVMRSASSELQETVEELQATVRAAHPATQGACSANPKGERPA
jgi:hypothetical protein